MVDNYFDTVANSWPTNFYDRIGLCILSERLLLYQ